MGSEIHPHTHTRTHTHTDTHTLKLGIYVRELESTVDHREKERIVVLYKEIYTNQPTSLQVSSGANQTNNFIRRI